MESPEFDAVVVPSDMPTITSRFSPLNPRVSPVSTESVDRVVVESPVSDDVPIVELDMLPDVSQFALLITQGSQVSHLSSVQLSPNRISTPYLACFVTGVAFVACFTGCRLSASSGVRPHRCLLDITQQTCIL